MFFLDLVMPYVAIIVVCLLFSIPAIWGVFFTISLAGTVFGMIEKFYYEFDRKLAKQKQKIFAKLDAAKPAPAVAKQRIPIMRIAVPVTLVGLPLAIAAVISITAFMQFGTHHGTTMHGQGMQQHMQQMGQVPQPAPAPTDVTEIDGKTIYDANCAVCHQANGQGIAGTFPPLDQSEWVIGDPQNAIRVILSGLSGKIDVKGTVYNSVMPGFSALLSDEETLALVNYIRSNWSNSAEATTIDVVKTNRELLKQKPAPITVNDLVAN